MPVFLKTALAFCKIKKIQDNDRQDRMMMINAHTTQLKKIVLVALSLTFNMYRSIRKPAQWNSVFQDINEDIQSTFINAG